MSTTFACEHQETHELYFLKFVLITLTELCIKRLDAILKNYTRNVSYCGVVLAIGSTKYTTQHQKDFVRRVFALDVSLNVCFYRQYLS